MKLFVALVALAGLQLVSLNAQGADWADLKVKFVYDGPAPKLGALPTASSSDAFCAEQKVPDETMIIAKDGGLANIVLGVDAKESDLESDEVHPDLAKVPEAIVLDNVKCQFVPHVFFVRKSQDITVRNSDTSGHNANFNFFTNIGWNNLIPPGGEKTFKVQESEDRTMGLRVDCNIHPWMKAYVVVKDHPYVAVSGEDGVIEIKGLPARKLTFRIWHENQNRSIQEATVDGKTEKWRRGYFEVDLKPGKNDLGTIKIAADQFKDL